MVESTLALRCNWPEGWPPWNPGIAPRPDHSTITNTPYDPLLDKFKSMQNSFPHLRTGAREDSIEELSRGVVFSFQQTPTYAIWLVTEPPGLLGEQSLVKSPHVPKTHAPPWI